ncbi:ribosome-associated translation inhibitor RaiA [Candidatus Kaiserbacteria bacterium]|nr:ribosome-associated translation inhibitor RaiA [Candidatus Kaiserbacteria bacterium]
MHHSVKTTDFQMTPEVSEYLSAKLVSLEKYISKDDESVKCEVEIGRTTEHHQSGPIFRVEINVSIGKKLLRAEATEESINAAIDSAKDEMVKRLRRHKGRQFALLRKGGEKIKNFLRFGRR